MLLTSFRLGRLELPSRIVMSPMTRSRAIGHQPNSVMSEYYAQRASAALVIAEGIAPSPNGLGYARIPGLYSGEQVEGWRLTTQAVHAAGGRIFAQLMHTGRIAHPENMPPTARIVAPSAVQAEGQMWTDAKQMQPFPMPEGMSEADVRAARDEFVVAAKNAIAAGFDGVELHGANGYLLEQFLNPGTNRRTDAYGGSVERRARFVVEVAEATAKEIGHDRLGIRFSPYNPFNDMPAYDEVDAQYRHLATALKDLAYVHVVGSAHPAFARTADALRERFGVFILNGNLSPETAEKALVEKRADLVSFARLFIANPDLPRRIAAGAPLAEPDPTTFYTPGPKGYTDYPPLG